ncbi:MAG: flagellar biosynthesis anti-sigma factor FlgM [Sulfuriferula sp.]
MKITDSIKNIANASVGNTATNSTKSSERTTAAPSSNMGAKVTLSPLSSQLQALQVQIAGTSAFDTKKVEAIKLAIADGQFQVDSGKIANELITSVRDLLQSRNG